MKPNSNDINPTSYAFDSSFQSNLSLNSVDYKTITINKYNGTKNTA